MSRAMKLSLCVLCLLIAGALWSGYLLSWLEKRDHEVEVRVFVVAQNHATRSVAGMRVVAVPADKFESRLTAPGGEVQASVAEFLRQVDACAEQADVFRKEAESLTKWAAREREKRAALGGMILEMQRAVLLADSEFDAQVEAEAVKLMVEEHNRAFSQAAAKVDLVYTSGHPRLVELRIELVRLLRAGMVTDAARLASDAAADVRKGADPEEASRRLDRALAASKFDPRDPAADRLAEAAGHVPAVQIQRQSQAVIKSCRDCLRAFKSDESNFTLRGESSAAGVRKIVQQLEGLVDECQKTVSPSYRPIGSFSTIREDRPTSLDLLLDQRVRMDAPYKASAAKREAVFREHLEKIKRSGFMTDEGLAAIAATYDVTLGGKMSGECEGLALLASEHAAGGIRPSDSALVKAMWANPGRLIAEPPSGTYSSQRAVTRLQYQRDVAGALREGFCNEMQVLANSIRSEKPVDQSCNEARAKPRRELLEFVVASSAQLRDRVRRLAATAYFPEAQAVASGLTDDRGTCQLKLPKGSYYICAHSDVYGHWAAPSQVKGDAVIALSNSELRRETVPFGSDLLQVARVREENPWVLKTSLAEDASPVSSIPNAGQAIAKLGKIETAMRAAEAGLRPQDFLGRIYDSQVQMEMLAIEKALQDPPPKR